MCHGIQIKYCEKSPKTIHFLAIDAYFGGHLDAERHRWAILIPFDRTTISHFRPFKMKGRKTTVPVAERQRKRRRRVTIQHRPKRQISKSSSKNSDKTKQHQQQLAAQSARMTKTRNQETPQQRKTRLATNAARITAIRINEQPQDRDRRLHQKSVRQACVRLSKNSTSNESFVFTPPPTTPNSTVLLMRMFFERIFEDWRQCDCCSAYRPSSKLNHPISAAHAQAHGISHTQYHIFRSFPASYQQRGIIFDSSNNWKWICSSDSKCDAVMEYCATDVRNSNPGKWRWLWRFCDRFYVLSCVWYPPQFLQCQQHPLHSKKTSCDFVARACVRTQTHRSITLLIRIIDFILSCLLNSLMPYWKKTTQRAHLCHRQNILYIWVGFIALFYWSWKSAVGWKSGRKRQLQ